MPRLLDLSPLPFSKVTADQVVDLLLLHPLPARMPRIRMAKFRLLVDHLLQLREHHLRPHMQLHRLRQKAAQWLHHRQAHLVQDSEALRKPRIYSCHLPRGLIPGHPPLSQRVLRLQSTLQVIGLTSHQDRSRYFSF